MDPFSNTSYAQLPSDVVDLLRKFAAPPRLIAHSIVVHDVAVKITDGINRAFPDLHYDREAVLFGAATHDSGKAICIAELDHPGKDHETRGVELLHEIGIPHRRARFAHTHGNWEDTDDLTIEDLLVALADKCWKGMRVDELEAMIVHFLTDASSRPEWDCYAELDAILTSVAQEADERLDWQRTFSSQREL